MNAATLARIEELRHADPTLLRLLFRHALESPGALGGNPPPVAVGPMLTFTDMDFELIKSIQ